MSSAPITRQMFLSYSGLEARERKSALSQPARARVPRSAQPMSVARVERAESEEWEASPRGFQETQRSTFPIRCTHADAELQTHSTCVGAGRAVPFPVLQQNTARERLHAASCGFVEQERLRLQKRRANP